MNSKRKYIQIGLESLIPLLGLYLWHWNLYFIILFYFLDILADEWIIHLKSKRTIEHSPSQKKDWFRLGLVSSIALISSMTAIHLAIFMIMQGISFKAEIIAFWTYEELGIQQGYLFVPLVFLLSYQQYKMEFLMPARYRQAKLKDIWKRHLTALFLLLIFALAISGLSLLVVFTEEVYVIGIVLITSIYKAFF